jgi:hypothetical protein
MLLLSAAVLLSCAPPRPHVRFLECEIAHVDVNHLSAEFDRRGRASSHTETQRIKRGMFVELIG